jgi:hypothetical protein
MPTRRAYARGSPIGKSNPSTTPRRQASRGTPSRSSTGPSRPTGRGASAR